MLGPHAVRSLTRNLRAAALKRPYHVDDLRFLLSTRRENILDCFPNPSSLEDTAADEDAVGTAPNLKFIEGGQRSSSRPMLIDRHAVFVKSVDELMMAARRSSQLDRERIPNTATTSSLEQQEEVVESEENVDVTCEADNNAPVSKILSVSSTTAIQRYFWLNKRLAPLASEDGGTTAAKRSKGVVASAAAIGAYEDIIHKQHMDSFPFADRFFGDALKGTVHDFISESLQTHVAVMADDFVLAVDTTLTEPFAKAVTVDPATIGTEDEMEAMPAVLPRFDIKFNFIMNGKLTNTGRVQVVNTHLYVLECHPCAHGAANAGDNGLPALVEHVGLLDVKSLVDSGAPVAANKRRLGAVQQHTVSLRLQNAVSDGCAGAVKGRLFFKVGMHNEDLTNSPIRCVEFGPVAMKH